MITGVHAVIYSQQADDVRAFCRDILGWDSVDAGHGWLIFALPPAELGVHPTDGPPQQELYLMCDEIESTIADLKGKGVTFANDGEITNAGFGKVAEIVLPGGGPLHVYEPRHATPI
jgi:hypothetical protein